MSKHVYHMRTKDLTTVSNSSIVTASTPIQAQQSKHQVTPSTNNRTTSCIQASASLNTPQITTPSDISSPSSASISPKFRNLNKIYKKYEVDNIVGLNSLFALFCHVDDSIHFENAITEENWVVEMEEEIEAIEKNDTWELVNLPKGKHVIGMKWVYKTKSNVDGKFERHKVTLIVK